ncbi:hypothetical protein BD626DRAFT_635465 [Schizophyllum amplum]|uniref:Uncharacterized protein n=1 Tax=Schizophyllum amplum TaxID=97359 RepID=A0A550BW87_9AGAR|nr:hypothetical protein BD626DRAFT_635465 [Auriculariopsis ampla]
MVTVVLKKTSLWSWSTRPLKSKTPSQSGTLVLYEVLVVVQDEHLTIVLDKALEFMLEIVMRFGVVLNNALVVVLDDEILVGVLDKACTVVLYDAIVMLLDIPETPARGRHEDRDSARRDPRGRGSDARYIIPATGLDEELIVVHDGVLVATDDRGLAVMPGTGHVVTVPDDTLAVVHNDVLAVRNWPIVVLDHTLALFDDIQSIAANETLLVMLNETLPVMSKFDRPTLVLDEELIAVHNGSPLVAVDEGLEDVLEEALVIELNETPPPVVVD